MVTMMREYHHQQGSDDDDPLLLARCVVPALPRHHVDRPRLSAALDAGATQPLTLVCAPAGTGKTTAVAAWALGRPLQAHGDTLGWLTFMRGDDRPNIFWPLVMACLRRCGVPLPAEADPGYAGSQRAMLSLVGATLAELDRPVLLVLDGYEIADADLADGMEFLLNRSAGRLKLVIVTRSLPSLPLHRLRLADGLAELRAPELAFTHVETARLLQKADLSVTPDALCDLQERTRGWAAGLRFAVMSSVRCREPERSLASVSGASGDIGDYLRTEMLATQTAGARELLLRTCMLEVVEPGVLEALAGRSAARAMAGLVQGNVLVDEVAGMPGSYRYHPLLSDLLRAELADGAPGLLTSLEEQAAAWYAEHTPAVQRGVPPAVRPSRLPDGGLLEPLTAKEREVLGHLAELLSTEEIAAVMFVSVNTVRTHVRNVLRKLAVNRRNDAIRRARSLRLLDS